MSNTVAVMISADTDYSDAVQKTNDMNHEHTPKNILLKKIYYNKNSYILIYSKTDSEEFAKVYNLRGDLQERFAPSELTQKYHLSEYTEIPIDRGSRVVAT